MKGSTTRRLLVGSVAALGLVLPVSSCSVVDKAGAAAVVNGQVIEESDLAAAMADLRAAKIQVDPQTVLNLLVLSGPVADQVAKSGSWKPDDAYTKFMAQIPNPSPATVEVVKTNSAIASLTTADKAAVLADLKSSTVTVNPRYGTFSTSSVQITPPSPSWIQKSTTSVPTP